MLRIGWLSGLRSNLSGIMVYSTACFTPMRIIFCEEVNLYGSKVRRTDKRKPIQTDGFFFWKCINRGFEPLGSSVKKTVRGTVFSEKW